MNGACTVTNTVEIKQNKMKKPRRRKRKRILYYIQGISILNVLAIHTRLFHGTYIFKHFVNRAVSIFMVCFGISSKLWCDDYRMKNNITSNLYVDNIILYKNFIVGRFKRLFFSWWLTLFSWKVLGVAKKTEYLFQLTNLKPRSINWFYAFFLGYTPHLGASWFVTEICLQISIYPILHYIFLLPPSTKWRKKSINKNDNNNKTSTTMMIQEQSKENEKRRSINNIIDTAYLSILILCSSLSAYIPNDFLQEKKSMVGIESSHIIWPSLFFGKIMFGSMILSQYFNYGGNNNEQLLDIPATYGMLSSIATIVGSFIHVYFLSPNPLNFDDNQPFKQVIRELIDIPLAYSMFWIVQLLVMTTSITDDDHQKLPPNNSNISRLKNLINVCSEYVQHILYYIGRNTWSLYLGHLILQNAINFDYIPRLSFINRDKSRLLHFSILFGSSILFKTLKDYIEELF